MAASRPMYSASTCPPVCGCSSSDVNRAAVRGRRSLRVLGSPEAAVPSSPAHGDEDAVRIGVITLGCDKNTVDTERTLARLAHAGARVQSGAGDVDVLVVNTCGFIDAAK